MKKILALALTGTMAFSAFAATASAAHYVNRYGYCTSCGEYHDWYDYDYYDGGVVVTAQNWVNGVVTATNKYLPTGVTATTTWTESTGAVDKTTGKITGAGNYSLTGTVTYTYKVGNKEIKETVPVTIGGYAYESETSALKSGRPYSYSGAYGYGDYWYDYDWDYDYGYYPSYYGYEVNWDTDVFYYDGTAQIPTATVTIGKKTVELNVSVIGNKKSIEPGTYKAKASLPARYAAYFGGKLKDTVITYTIEEPLKDGIVKENGKLYGYDNGKKITGWEDINGATYYFDEKGVAATDWAWIGEYWYYFGDNGKMQTGWAKDGGEIYYLHETGKMASEEWVSIDGDWYYFNEPGDMAESQWIQTSGKWYYVTADGKMATSTKVPGGYYVNADGVWVK